MLKKIEEKTYSFYFEKCDFVVNNSKIKMDIILDRPFIKKKKKIWKICLK
jgi:hypothetical protein